jgi:uncharacterized repeat protein (TIGR03803 family)
MNLTRAFERGLVLKFLARAAAFWLAAASPWAAPHAAAQTSDTLLHSFAGNPDGAYPQAGLVQDAEGFFYGTSGDGEFRCGAIYRISPAGKYKIIHSLDCGAEGIAPYSKLTLASDGFLYGTTEGGGANGEGTLYRVSRSGKFVVLDDFGSLKGIEAVSGVMQASDGRLYGTTARGGAEKQGTIFRVTPRGKIQTIHSFSRTLNLGARNPAARLVEANDGALYGVTPFGGTKDWGTAFRLRSNGRVEIIASFGGDFRDIAEPESALMQATDGALYGVTASGGAFGSGSVYRLTLQGALTALHYFRFEEGSMPRGQLVQGDDGRLYGVMSESNGVARAGGVFSIGLNGSFQVDYEFLGQFDDGSYPFSRLLKASDGRLYGTTYRGGRFGTGTVCRLNLD